MLHQRQPFEAKLKELHRQSLAMHSHMKEEKLEATEYKKWDAMQAQTSKKRKTDLCPMPCAACDAFWN